MKLKMNKKEAAVANMVNDGHAQQKVVTLHVC